jgi:alpha-tubulin suppressor-like RCC1 family protein
MVGGTNGATFDTSLSIHTLAAILISSLLISCSGSNNPPGAGPDTKSPDASSGPHADDTDTRTQGPAKLAFKAGDSYNFEEVVVDTTQSITVSIGYSGGVPAENVNVALNGNDGFSIKSNGCPEVVESNCSVDVEFAPTETGSKSAELKVDYHDGSTSQSISFELKAAVEVEGIPSLSIENDYDNNKLYDFDRVSVTTSESKTLNVEFSGGPEATEVETELKTGDVFEIESTDCSGTVSQDCRIDIVFDPEKALSYQDELIISYVSEPHPTNPVTGGDEMTVRGIGLGDMKVNEVATSWEAHTCAILEDNTLRCWGKSIDGQLGLGSEGSTNVTSMGDARPRVDLGTNRTVKDVALGEHHTCAILDNGDIKCWGLGGLLGLGDKESRGDEEGEMGDNLPALDFHEERDAVQISAGLEHTCAIFSDNTLTCWGYNGSGQLGIGEVAELGNEPNPFIADSGDVNVGSNRYPTKVAAGGRHTCALLDNGSIKCWGNNEYGQLGRGDTKQFGRDAPLSSKYPTVDLGSGDSISSVTAGQHHTCALLNDGSVKCWGRNQHGQLGLGDMEHRGDEASEMGDSLPTVKLGGEVKAIDAGGHHTCAILEDDSLKCWGYNFDGQLGLGDRSEAGQAPDHPGEDEISVTERRNRGDQSDEMGESLAKVDLGSSRFPTQISSGLNYNCALLDNGRIKCWGDSESGKLGGMPERMGDDEGEMGDNLPVVDVGSRDSTSPDAAEKPTVSIVSPEVPDSPPLEVSTLELEAKASDPDGGSIQSYEWEITDDRGTTNSFTGNDISISPWDASNGFEPGSFDIKVTVTDDEGQKASASVAVELGRTG